MSTGSHWSAVQTQTSVNFCVPLKAAQEGRFSCKMANIGTVLKSLTKSLIFPISSFYYLFTLIIQTSSLLKHQTLNITYKSILMIQSCNVSKMLSHTTLVKQWSYSRCQLCNETDVNNIKSSLYLVIHVIPRCNIRIVLHEKRSA